MKKKFDHELPLLDALKIMAPLSSNNTLRTWVKEGRVSINDTLVRNLGLVASGQTIEIREKRIKKQGSLPILYEDAHFVVIDKPASLLSVSTVFQSVKTAHALLKERFPHRKVSVVHRLDQDTSGVMVFALSDLAYQHLKKELKHHKMERIYYAVLEGKLSGSGTWDSYLIEDESYYVHVTDDKEIGERAITHFEVIKASERKSLVQLRLETGKKNQIRVHAKEAGHPVVGDRKYGSSVKREKRLFLHSHILVLTHPVTHKKMTFTSPVPKEFFKV